MIGGGRRRYFLLFHCLDLRWFEIVSAKLFRARGRGQPLNSQVDQVALEVGLFQVEQPGREKVDGARRRTKKVDGEKNSFSSQTLDRICDGCPDGLPTDGKDGDQNGGQTRQQECPDRQRHPVCKVLECRRSLA